MRICYVVDTNGRSENGFTFDTCVGIKICENPNIGSLLTCRVDFENSKIHLNSQTIIEATRLGYDIEQVSIKIQKLIGTSIVQGIVSERMQTGAGILEDLCPTLHAGDSQILAYAKFTKTTLVTCDKGLAEAARSVGVKVVNPDLLPCDKLVKDVKKARFSGIVKKAIVKPSQAKQKVKTIALKPGQKIVWSLTG